MSYTIVTTNTRIQNALNFINSFAPGSNNSLYQFIGQTNPPFTPSAGPPNESLYYYKSIWQNMIAAQLITLNNMVTVIANNVWSNGAIYNAYNDQYGGLFTSNVPFYIMNSNNEIFKCLANNNGGQSFFSPAGFNSANNYVQTLSDGYVWKYMYNVSPTDSFLTMDWIPVYPIAPINSYQNIIEQAAVPGSIDYINVIQGGQNYGNTTISYIVNITGDGTGANAYATVISGQIESITMVTPGQGYTYANVSFTDVNGSGAIAQAIMPPLGGHGANAVYELGATSVEISTTTTGTMGGYYTTNNAFTQTGLIINPLQYASNTVSTNTIVRVYTTLNLTGGIGVFNINEEVYQGTSLSTATFIGNVVDFNNTTGIIQLNNVIGTPIVGQILYGTQSGAQRYVINFITPDVQQYTGDLLNVSNLTQSIQRLSTQTENYQYIFKF